MEKIKIRYKDKYLMGNLFFSNDDDDFLNLRYYNDKFEILNDINNSIVYLDNNLDLQNNSKNKLLFTADFSDLNNVIFITIINNVEYALTYKNKELRFKKYNKKYIKRQIFTVIFEDLNESKDININFYPLTKKKDIYIEGYWETFTNKNGSDFDSDKYYKNVEENFVKNNYKQKYPYPLPTKEILNSKFLKKIEKLEEKIQNGKIGETSNQKGPSYCRICDDRRLSSEECNFIYKKIKYCFPSGILHYYKEHNVKPSEEFEEAVMKTKL
uniref:Uncharacterized protein n=1 Tax=viral metagenome TaxID=1070528 RepID=A0A6C0AFK4_9ZZZZ